MKKIEDKLSNYFTVKAFPGRGNLTVFVLGAWKFNPILYTPLIRKLRRRDVSCYLFVPRSQLISAGMPYSEIVKASEAVTTELKKLIAERIVQDTTARFSVLGFSIGTAFALKAAKESPEIERVALIAAHGDFSEHVLLWNDQRWVNKLLRFNKILVSQPTTVVESGKVLNRLEPTGDLKRLDNKQIYFGYGEKDGIMHAKVAQKMIEDLRKANLDLTVRVVHGGHHATIIKGGILGNDVFKFLVDR